MSSMLTRRRTWRPLVRCCPREVNPARAALPPGCRDRIMLALGIYRETEFSPGKVEADKAILDAVLSALERDGFRVAATKPARLGELRDEHADLILAMCQGEAALGWLAAA